MTSPLSIAGYHSTSPEGWLLLNDPSEGDPCSLQRDPRDFGLFGEGEASLTERLVGAE